MGEEAWRAQQAERQRRHRAKPDGRLKSRQYGQAQGRALSRLAALHPQDYEALLTEERIAAGLPAQRWERTSPGRPDLSPPATYAVRNPS